MAKIKHKKENNNLLIAKLKIRAKIAINIFADKGRCVRPTLSRFDFILLF
jgi:hypothetical protein